jgi:integrase
LALSCALACPGVSGVFEAAIFSSSPAGTSANQSPRLGSSICRDGRVCQYDRQLRPTLVAQLLATGRGPDDLVFGRTAALPFVPSTIRAVAREA